MPHPLLRGSSNNVNQSELPPCLSQGPQASKQLNKVKTQNIESLAQQPPIANI
jgi:hypothetical protein